MSRTYQRPMRDLRAAILARLQTPDATRPEMFRILSISEQPPPGFSPDWLAATSIPSGYLEPYRRLTLAEQANDLGAARGDWRPLLAVRVRSERPPGAISLWTDHSLHRARARRDRSSGLRGRPDGLGWRALGDVERRSGLREVSRHSVRRPDGERPRAVLRLLNSLE